jgi:hypothetical protein
MPMIGFMAKLGKTVVDFSASAINPSQRLVRG